MGYTKFTKAYTLDLASQISIYAQEERDIPKYVSAIYNVIGKVGEGTYGNVYLAHSKTQQSKILAVKTFKTSKVETPSLMESVWP